MAFSVAWFRTPRRPARPRGGRARQAHIATPGPDPERRNNAHLAHAGRRATRGRPRIPAWPRGRSASLRTSRGRNGFTEQPRAMATCGSLAAIVRVPECLARGRCQRMQDVDRVADVETPAQPAGHRRAGVGLLLAERGWLRGRVLERSRGNVFVYQAGVRVCDLRTLIQRFSRRFERLRQRNFPPSSEASLRRRPLEVLPDQELERAEVAVGEGLGTAPAGGDGGLGSVEAGDRAEQVLVVLAQLQLDGPGEHGIAGELTRGAGAVAAGVDQGAEAQAPEPPGHGAPGPAQLPGAGLHVEAVAPQAGQHRGVARLVPGPDAEAALRLRQSQVPALWHRA